MLERRRDIIAFVVMDYVAARELDL